MRMHFRFKILHVPFNLVDQVLLLQHVKILLALVESCLILNAVVDTLLEVFHLIERAGCEVLRRWVVFFDRFKVADDDSGAVFLLVDYTLQVVELAVHFGSDLIFEALLVPDLFLHVLALLEITAALLLNRLQVLNVHIGRLLQSERLAPVFLVSEVALIAKGRVVRSCVDLQLTHIALTRAELDLIILLSNR